MKIRTDFVTNSSSSSFCVEITVVGKNGGCTKVNINPEDTYLGGGGAASFNVSTLKTITGIESVYELGKVLTDSVVLLDYCDDEGEECPNESLKKLSKKYNDEALKPMAKQLTDFEKNLSISFVSTSDISSIIITKTHNAWGEFMEYDGMVKLLTKKVEPNINDEENTETEWERNIVDMQSGNITVETSCDMSQCVDFVDIQGKKFVITGKLDNFECREEFEEYIQDLGGSVVGAISKNVDYLISNDSDSASSKTKKAKELNIPIISEADFFEMFEDEEY